MRARDFAQTLMSKLLDVKSAKTGRRCVHHVMALPCGGGATGHSALFASGHEAMGVALPKVWRGAGSPGTHAMREHPHLRALLEPLIRAIASSAEGSLADVT